MDARGGRTGGLEPVSIHWVAEGMEALVSYTCHGPVRT